MGLTIKLSMICTKQDNGSYFALCPEVEGCFTQGDTYEDACANLKDLVETTLAEEYSEESIQELAFSNGKIFSEFEVSV